MTVADKIQSFASVSQLLEEIKKDSQSTAVLNRRYAVRFIMLDNFNLYQEFIKEMTKSDIQIFNLEQLVDSENKDSWISNDTLVNAIRNLKGKIVVSPFSEIVRFYKDDKFKALFEGMSLMELDTTTRIYIPLIGLKHRFENFLNTFSRIEESQPIWAVYCGESQPVEIDLIPHTFPCPDSFICLRTVYDWLVFWKTHAPTERILCLSDTINTYSKNSQPDNIFEIKKIESAYSFITQLLNVQTEIEYKQEEERFWVQLLQFIGDNSFSSFKAFVDNHIDIGKISTEKMLNKWTATDTTEFDRWLLRHYYLQHIYNNEYLTEIIENCINYSSSYLFHKIALSIFDIENEQDYYGQRNQLLLMFDEQFNLSDSDLTTLEEKIKDVAKNNTVTAIKLCSGKFSFEKELFIDWYKDRKLSLSKLQNIYPDFAAYLSDNKYDSWANNYIQLYKQAKIEDKYTDEIKNFITEKNANETSFYAWYHTFELSKELLAEENPDKVYWLDGVGIEWLSLIRHCIENSDFQIKKIEIARTGIPSSTEHNSFEHVIKIDDLDKFIHSEQYKYPSSICKEIDIVKNMLTNILNQSGETTIAIVSDHGLTALSRLVDSKKYTAKASHEGRYMKLESTESIEDTDYIRHKNGDDFYKVALTHASLNNKPVREVHGGCIPEEILVPFIVISNKKSARTVEKNTEAKQQTENIVSNTQKAKGFEEEELF